ncbi:DinB family protein [Arachidicoccus terrestris]|uniref:DinB family protein n=1 Tax=Arachidicoccus terrestris TaxID=2875539 RepID=UPI001CC8234B|nr:DinB family protein [Arachidicoccus terrestris]UAY56069.1 DinB family protein [Arachidicoccus terrestris]
MKEAATCLQRQYDLIRGSRARLLNYCQTISNEDFLNENSSFGLGGSIRNLLVHIVNTYQSWIIKRALQKNIDFTEYSAVKTNEEAETLFRFIDEEVMTFIEKYEMTLFEKIRLDVRGTIKPLSPFELFTHVTTHEFHHKGQILSLSRHLGYTPVDTDIIQ